VYDRHPETIGNLIAGGQFFQTGRFFGSETFGVALTGTLGDRAIEFAETIEFSGSDLPVAQIWAGHKIDYLLQQIKEFGEVKELVDAIIWLSTNYSVLSPYTAFLIIEPGAGGDIPIPVEDETSPEPQTFALFQNYPNPFNPETTIRYHLARSSDCAQCLVRIEIYNLRGELVRVLVNEQQAPGEYSVIWDGRDDRGLQAPSGLYFYKIVVGKFVSSRKMTLVR